MSTGARRVVFRTGEPPPSSGLALPYGRTGHFSYTNRSHSLQIRRPGPPSWRFRRRQPTDEGYDADASDHEGGGVDGYPAWQQNVRRPLSRQMRHRLKTEEVNKRLHEQWDGCFQDNVFRHTCHQADRQELAEALQSRLAAEYATAARAAIPACPSCSQAGSMVSASTDQMLYVAIEGRVLVNHPVFRCTACDEVHIAHPTSFGCFPATPTEPQICYAVSLLQLTCRVGLAGPLSMEAWCSTLESMHAWNGCSDSDSSAAQYGVAKVWRNLSMAAQQWQRVVSSAEDLDRYNITQIGSSVDDQPGDAVAENRAELTGQNAAASCNPVQGPPQSPGHDGLDDDQQATSAEQACQCHFSGPTNQCPCCWRTCQAVMADACLGITHLKAAGRAADAIKPLQVQTPFVEDSAIKELLVRRRDIDPASLERPTCSEFVAAAKGFSDRQARLHMQVQFSNMQNHYRILWLPLHQACRR